jgi:hypothetical protein
MLRLLALYSFSTLVLLASSLILYRKIRNDLAQSDRPRLFQFPLHSLFVVIRLFSSIRCIICGAGIAQSVQCLTTNWTTW